MITYQGNAPTFALPDEYPYEETDKLNEWLYSVAPEEIVDEILESSKNKASDGGLLEYLLWRINDLGGAPTLVCDQWVRVDCVGKIMGQEVKTEIQADSFLMATIETYRWWKEKTRELAGNSDEQ